MSSEQLQLSARQYLQLLQLEAKKCGSPVVVVSVNEAEKLIAEIERLEKIERDHSQILNRF